MMASIREYIVSVVAAAVLCGAVRSLLPGKGTAAALIRLVSGIFLAFVVVQPAVNIDLGSFPALMEDYSDAGALAASQGEDLAQEASAAIIKSQTEAYILDKAEALGLALDVEVTVSAGELPIPASVRISGAVPPYARAQLEAAIENDLGIPKEDQQWTG